ncbi:RING finger protein 10-like [Anopheles albimanus]|uniref:E3 ubiquitin-protein ligase RNF10 n=1 Tax=Anopheles albimanus TaxID=7167 RepID=A0A8W7JB71_ANOAL|nr:RING finger protein 10-like [Anopheles albimanus]
MEKNRFVNQNVAKGQLSDGKKNQDVSTKWPRQSKRRSDQPDTGNHRNGNGGSSGGRAPNANKTRNPSNYNYDARQRPASQRSAKPPEQQTASTAGRYDEEEDEEYEVGRAAGLGLSGKPNPPTRAGGGELHSVFSPGSKKQSLNHLLNFHYAPRDRDQPARFSRTGNFRRTQYASQHSYNKEQFLQANCQFVVRAGEDYGLFQASPDQLVDWAKIEQIHVLSAEEPQCPICLYPPVAAKMTKCGHVYCWPCILHYLALSDKAWRKCPICYDAIHLPDLRSAVSKPFHAYGTGEYVTLQLMRREKGTMTVMEVTDEQSPTSSEHSIPHFDANAGNSILTKLLLTDTAQMLNIMDREKTELENQIVADGGAESPENMFVQQALDLLAERRNAIATGERIVFAVRKPMSTTMITPVMTSATPSPSSDDGDSISQDGSEDTNCGIGGGDTNTKASVSSSIDFLIDEENNFSVSDIDIVPTAQCAGNYYYFYQSIDGQPLFLHSINSRMLQTMYGSLERAPRRITGRVVQKDACSMDETLRRRLKYLQHLPVCTQFEVVELDFGSPTAGGDEAAVVSTEVLAAFSDELAVRRRNRERREREERKREKKIFEFNERQLGKAMARSARISIDSTKHFPMCGSADSYDAAPLLIGTSPGASSDVSNSSPGTSAPGLSSWSKMVATQPASSSQQRWPALGSTASVPVPTQKVTQVTGSRMTVTNVSTRTGWHHLPASEDDEEDNEETLAARAPRFNNSLGSAIEAALEKASSKQKQNKKPGNMVSSQQEQDLQVAADNGSGRATGAAGSGKRKKGKKILLVASGVNLN